MKTVILCDSCDGKGHTYHTELTNYHKGEYEDWLETCYKCSGSGRLVQTTMVTIEPYIPVSQEHIGRK